MKDTIKQILRETIEKNSLGVTITRPNQELILMRGIPGSGKSTKAKSLVGNGIIHSTDDVIEKTGSYRDFFEKMHLKKDFGALHGMHKQNFRNAVKSMETGITPVIIDNTNIKKAESKDYVVAALEMGFSDKNIRWEDVGTGGLSAAALAKRNTHGVPLDTIEKMIASYNSVTELTVESVVGSNYTKPDSNIQYSAVVLNQLSHDNLVNHPYPVEIPSDWKIYAHHMTIVFGKGLDDKKEIGKEVVLHVTHVGKSDMAMAVRVSGYPSKNAIPHITLAINPNGGKPVMSNQITDWQEIKQFDVVGNVIEISK